MKTNITKQNKTSLLKRIVLSTAVVGALTSCADYEQTVRVETYQGHRINEGVKSLYFNSNPRISRDDEKTYIIKGNQNLEIGNKYSIYETETFFGKKLDSIVPYKTN